jgi:hypothetical protein
LELLSKCKHYKGIIPKHEKKVSLKKLINKRKSKAKRLRDRCGFGLNDQRRINKESLQHKKSEFESI